MNGYRSNKENPEIHHSVHEINLSAEALKYFLSSDRRFDVLVECVPAHWLFTNLPLERKGLLIV